MRRAEEVDAKEIIEEGFADFDGLTSRTGRLSVLEAGEPGTVRHEAVFQHRPLRPLRELMLAFRGRRYIRSIHGTDPAEVGYERRLTLAFNGRSNRFETSVRAGEAARTATRHAGDWHWVRLSFQPRRFAAGDRLGLSFEFDERLPAPPLAITYLVPLLLLDERGEAYLEEPLIFRVRGTTAASLTVDVPSFAGAGPLPVRVSALDRLGNLAETFCDTLVCRLGGREVRAEAKGGRAFTDALIAPSEGMHRLSVRGTRSGLRGRSNCFLAGSGAGAGRLVWGDIHGHSISSDGVGTADEHYRYAREVRYMDVAALTDHDNQIIANGAWPLLQRKARQWSEPGRFVVLPAYEWAQPYEAERNYGHKNFYFRTYAGNPLLSGDTADGTDAETPEKLYPKLNPDRCVIVSHHPAYESWMWTDWERLRGDREPVIEVYSSHGASDEPDTIKPLPDSNPERFIFPNMRRRGLLLGFTGGSDYHAGLLALDFHPDRAEPEDRVMFKPWRGGLTAFWVERLSLDGVLDALQQRRTYATTGEKLLLVMEVNGRAFQPEVEAGGEARLRIKFGGTAPVRRLDVYKNSGIVHKAEDLEERFEYDWQDDEARAGDYYFVRVTQRDDQMAWSCVTRVS